MTASGRWKSSAVRTLLRQQIQRIAPPQAYVEQNEIRSRIRRATWCFIGRRWGGCIPTCAAHHVLNNLQGMRSTTCRWCCCIPGEYYGTEPDAVRAEFDGRQLLPGLQSDRDRRTCRCRFADMFQKDIDRPINGVIKVMQTDEENQSAGAGGIRHHARAAEALRLLFYRPLRAERGRRDRPDGRVDQRLFRQRQVGHFLKILSYLLANEVVGGPARGGLFRG